MGSGHAWAGHADLKKALDGLASAKGVSANRVKVVATTAYQYVKDYKRVVHDVEIFLWKGEVEHRLAALYAMDAIMRQSQAKLGSKDVFVKRFLIHMNNTIAAVKKIPADQQLNARHVIEEWQARGYYTPEDIEAAGGYEYSLNNPQPRAPPTTASGESSSAPGTRASPTHADAASKEKLASLLSIIKKQKELSGQSDTQPQPGLLPSPGKPTTSPFRPPNVASPPVRPGDSRLPLSSGYGGDDIGTSRALDRPRGRSRSRSRGRDRDRDNRDRDNRDRGELRDRDSRDRDRDRRPRDRSRSRDRGSSSIGRERRGSSPPPPARGRRDSGYGRREPLEDSRDTKKPRSSRWGPPRPEGREETRPPPVDAGRDRGRPSRFERRSPDGRTSGPPGPGPMYGSGPASGRGPWQDAGYQGPPPPFRSGPPPNSVPPPGQISSNTSYSAYNARPSQGPSSSYANGPSAMSSASSSTLDPPRSGNGADKSTGEVCRKFLAGRCTFGDRCRHAHTQDATTSSQPRTEINQAKRKTALCANFPLGQCRYGDRCSFAHGEDDLEPSATPRRFPNSQQAPASRMASPHGARNAGGAWSQAASAPTPPGPQVNAQAQSRLAFGANPPSSQPSVLSEPFGRAQDPSGARPANQWAGAAAAYGYGAGAYQTSYTPAVSAAVSTAPGSGPTRDRAQSRDEDEADAGGPEFTLQYDEDE